MRLFKREVKLSSIGDLALVVLKAIRLVDTNRVLITGTTMCHIDENEKLVFHDATHNIRKRAYILKMKDATNNRIFEWCIWNNDELAGWDRKIL